jgi:16S rRNA U1498 N3-methylase RsmE
MLLAIGPESGWEEPYELEMFKQYGFQVSVTDTQVWVWQTEHGGWQVSLD